MHERTAPVLFARYIIDPTHLTLFYAAQICRHALPDNDDTLATQAALQHCKPAKEELLCCRSSETAVASRSSSTG